MYDNKSYILNTIGALFLVASTNVYSYEFVKDFFLPATIQYDDNVTMGSSNAPDAFRYILTPKVVFSKLDEVNTFSLSGAINIVRSSVSEQLILDREDPTVNAKWVHQYARGNFSLGADYSKTSTRVSEFEQTGLVFRDGDSVNKQLYFSWAYEITERINSKLNLRTQKQTYTQSTLADYKNDAADFRVGYQHSERMKPFIEIGYSKFTSQASLGAVSTDNNLKRASVGLDYEHGPLLNWSLSVGINKNSDTEDTGWIANGNLNYEISNRTLINLAYNRSNNPTGLGGIQESDNLSINVKSVISDIDSVGGAVTWSKNNNLNSVTSKSLNAYYSHILSPKLTASLNFSYRNIDFNNNDASGAQLGFTLSYNYLNF